MQSEIGRHGNAASGRLRNVFPKPQWRVLLVLLSACALPEVTAHSSNAAAEPNAQTVSPAPPVAQVAPSSDAGTTGQQGAIGPSGEAGSSGDADARGEGAAGSAPSCSCTTRSECCDGCQPRNEQGACEDDSSACTRDVCLMGTCVHQVDGSSCLIAGQCYQDTEQNPANPCERCDAAGKPDGWVSATGSPCDDGMFCNGKDSCSNSQCRLHEGDPCNTQTDTCMLCDERARSCSANTALTWHDQTNGLLWQVKPQLDDTWQAATDHCEELTYCDRSGWRLPTVDELRGLVDGCPLLEPGGSCGVTTRCAAMSCVEGEHWCQVLCDGSAGPNDEVYLVPALTHGLNGEWSSTTVTDQPQEAWAIQYRVASLDAWEKVSTRSVRCVRAER